jgi:pilus assembly protein CpaB
MQKRTVLIGVFALVFGGSAAAGVYLLMDKPAEAPKAETVSVVVAASDISRGQTFTAEDLTQRDWPKDAVPEGALTNPQDVIDRTATTGLMKGDLLFDAKLAPKGAGKGLAAVIPAGMRAVTIQTPNIATGVAGFILPGNKVDVLLSMSAAGADDHTGGGSSLTLLQNVEILAVDQRIDAPQDNKMDTKELRSVTLLVSPADAAKLDLGQNKGTLHLALRNAEDRETADVEPATLAGLKIGRSAPVVIPQPVPVQVVKPVPLALPQKAPLQIRTFRGNSSAYFTLPPQESAADKPPMFVVDGADAGTGTAPRRVP